MTRQLKPRYKYNCCVRAPDNVRNHREYVDNESMVQVYDSHWKRTLAVMPDGNEAVVCTDGSILWLERL